MARRKRVEVDLFNFSFLDILACVIGLLIFILTIVVVSGSVARNSQSDARLSNAEHRLQEARAEFQLSQARRADIEQVLTTRARDAANPAATENAMRDEIGALENEKIQLDAATNDLSAKLESLKASLPAINQNASSDTTLADVQRQLRQLDEQTAELNGRAAQERQKVRTEVQRVSYYIPHVHEVFRVTLWLELEGDRLWCIGQGDYDSTTFDEDSVCFTRRADAPGTPVGGIVSDRAAVPPALLEALPSETVLEVALHSDGYEAYRKLRQWAWQRGFEVNWTPQAGNSIVLTRVKHVYAQ
jgi:hypothetical protein